MPRLAPVRRAAALAAALLVICQAARAEELRVGIASAVMPSATGALQAGAPKTLVLGADIQFKERIVTDRAGLAQIIFLDHSSLAIAPSSALVIDAFVYDPARSAGELAMSASRGLLRYIGGKISKGSDVTITTPVAMIAIRGGMVLVKIELSGRTTATFLYGEHMLVTAAGVTRTVTRPGFRVIVEAKGVVPSSPGRVPQAEINAALASFEGGGAGHHDVADGGSAGSGVVLGDESAEAAAGGAGPDPGSAIENAALSAVGGRPGSAGAPLAPLGLVVTDSAVSDQHVAAILNSQPLSVSALSLGSKLAATAAAPPAAVAGAAAAAASVSAAASPPATTVVASTVASAGTTALSGTAGASVGALASAAGGAVTSLTSAVSHVVAPVPIVGTVVPAIVAPVTSTVASVVPAILAPVTSIVAAVPAVASPLVSSVTSAAAAVVPAAVASTVPVVTATAAQTVTTTASVLVKPVTSLLKLH